MHSIKINGNERNVGCPIIYVYGYYSLCYSIRRSPNTRMHSSRMRTGRSLTVCCSLLPGGGGLLSALGGSVCSQGVSAPRGCLLQGVSTLGGGVCSGGCLLQGVSAPGGWVSALGGVSQNALRQTPSPPVDRILDTCL